MTLSLSRRAFFCVWLLPPTRRLAAKSCAAPAGDSAGALAQNHAGTFTPGERHLIQKLTTTILPPDREPRTGADPLTVQRMLSHHLATHPQRQADFQRGLAVLRPRLGRDFTRLDQDARERRLNLVWTPTLHPSAHQILTTLRHLAALEYFTRPEGRRHLGVHFRTVPCVRITYRK